MVVSSDSAPLGLLFAGFCLAATYLPDLPSLYRYPCACWTGTRRTRQDSLENTASSVPLSGSSLLNIPCPHARGQTRRLHRTTILPTLLRLLSSLHASYIIYLSHLLPASVFFISSIPPVRTSRQLPDATWSFIPNSHPHLALTGGGGGHILLLLRTTSTCIVLGTAYYSTTVPVGNLT